MKTAVNFILGPTAVGKTDIAIKLAKRINAEIISCDSMQIYKEISVLTNKPSNYEQKQIKHHLIDLLSVSEDFDVMVYCKFARKAIEKIIKKNKIPLVVGGTGFYASVLLNGIFEEDYKDVVLREMLQEEAEEKGSGVLYQKLAGLDKAAASKIHPNDTKRIIRCLEVCMLSKKKISVIRKKRNGIASQFNTKVFILNKDRQSLYNSINSRVEKMFRTGAVKEIKKIKKTKLSLTAAACLGVNEIKGYLSKKYTLKEAKEKIKQKTRNYAKRQLTWFRKMQNTDWINIDNMDKERIIEKIIAKLG